MSQMTHHLQKGWAEGGRWWDDRSELPSALAFGTPLVDPRRLLCAGDRSPWFSVVSSRADPDALDETQP